MKSHPSVPYIDDAPEALLDSGHLWLLEDVVGAPLRFRLRQSGLIEFGDADRVYASAEDLPAQYGHAVREVQEHLDREALRAAVEDPEAVVFFGVATQYQGIDYDWARLPSVLGTDVWSADAGAFRPPDAAAGIFDRLGLDSINAVAKEVNVRDFDPDSFEIPSSAWYDGPAGGVVVLDKQGHRGRLANPEASNVEPTPPTEPTPSTASTAAELAAELGTTGRFDRLTTQLREAGRPVTPEALFERAADSCFRELDPRTFGGDGIDRTAFRSELAALSRQFLDTHHQ